MASSGRQLRGRALRRLVSHSGAVVLLFALAIFVMYLPALIVPYGLSDDYLYLAQAEELGLPSPPYAESVMHAATTEGRPLWGALVKPVFAAAGTIDSLRFIRIITLVGIVALALLLYWALVRSKIARLPAALNALLVSTLPPFQLYASWTVSFVIPWAALLGGCSSLLAVTAAEAPRQRFDRLVWATALLVAALMIYQPAAMFYWVFFAVALVGSVADSGRALRLAQTHFGVAAAAAALGYLGYRICISIVGPDAPGADRGSLTRDVAGKAEWFAHWALYGALNLFDVTWSTWLAALVAAVAAGGIVLWLLRRATRPWGYVGLAAILIPLTVLPNLVVEETYEFEAYRALVSLSSLIGLYFGLGALALWLMFREWLEQRVSPRALLASERVALAIAIAFVATAAVVASRNIDTLIAEPQLRELRLLRGQVAALPEPVRNVSFVLSGPAERVPGSPFSDEFGYPSTSPWYPAEPLVLLLLREQGRLAPPHPSVSVLPWYTTPPEGASVVNLNGLLLRATER
jgi:hypothetical protein